MSWSEEKETHLNKSPHDFSSCNVWPHAFDLSCIVLLVRVIYVPLPTTNSGRVFGLSQPQQTNKGYATSKTGHVNLEALYGIHKQLPAPPSKNTEASLSSLGRLYKQIKWSNGQRL